MTTIARLLALVLALCMVLSLAGCSTKNADEANAAKPGMGEIPPSTVYLSENGAHFRMDLLTHFYEQTPYDEFFETDDEKEKDISIITKEFTAYQENFAPDIENIPENEDFLKNAVNPDPNIRLSVTNNANCPDELLLYIALYEPSFVVRHRAYGNIMSQENFPQEFLLALADSSNPITRYVSLLHPNRELFLQVATLLMQEPTNEEEKFLMDEALEICKGYFDPQPAVPMTELGRLHRFLILLEFYAKSPYDISLAMDIHSAFMGELPCQENITSEEFAAYKANFNPDVMKTLGNRSFLEGAINESPDVRMAVAGDANCPEKLLVYIAMNDPSVVVRYRALGNILSQDTFPQKYLSQMASSSHPFVRYIALLHANRNVLQDVAPMLKTESNMDVLEEAIYVAEAYLHENYPALYEQFKNGISGTGQYS